MLNFSGCPLALGLRDREKNIPLSGAFFLEIKGGGTHHEDVICNYRHVHWGGHRGARCASTQKDPSSVYFIHP